MDLTIKHVSEITGISKDALRYYEKEGILRANRHENGYRHYDETDIMILKYVAVMKYANFTLAEIKSITALFNQEPGSDCTVISKGTIEKKIVELGRTINNYQKIIALMKESLPILEGLCLFNEKNLEQMDGFVGRIFNDINEGELTQ